MQELQIPYYGNFTSNYTASVILLLVMEQELQWSLGIECSGAGTKAFILIDPERYDKFGYV